MPTSCIRMTVPIIYFVFKQRGTQGTSDQGYTANGSNGIFFPKSRPPKKCYRCSQPGHRHTECTATITLQHTPNSNGGAVGLGNAVMVTALPPTPCSAGPSASHSSTIMPMYTSSIRWASAPAKIYGFDAIRQVQFFWPHEFLEDR